VFINIFKNSKYQILNNCIIEDKLLVNIVCKSKKMLRRILKYRLILGRYFNFNFNFFFFFYYQKLTKFTSCGTYKDNNAGNGEDNTATKIKL